MSQSIPGQDRARRRYSVHNCSLNWRDRPCADTTTARPSRLARRLLGSALLEALTTPHGVDRYVELVRPAWSLQRGARRGRRRPPRDARDSVTLTLRPNAQLARLPRRPVRAASPSRSTACAAPRCYSPASSAHAGDLLELTVTRSPTAWSRRSCDERAAPGMVVGSRRPTATSRCPTSARERAAADQRRQRHHAGDVDAAHALRRGPRAADHVPALRARRSATSTYARRAAPRSRPRHPNVRLLRGFTRAGARRAATAASAASTCARPSSTRRGARPSSAARPR